MPPCKFSAFQSAAIKACDTLGDGVVDGVIGDPLACTFDPNSLVGTSTPCGTITAQDAAVVAKIVNGTRATSGDFLWYGPTWGTSFAGEVLGAGLGEHDSHRWHKSRRAIPARDRIPRDMGPAEPARPERDLGLDDDDV